MTAVHPLVERLLEKRKIENKEAFLNPSYDTRHDPLLLTGMEKAVERVLRAIEDRQKIVVWHDYDCDGIPGGALLHDFFELIGYPISTYVPERSEGYGLNESGMRTLAGEGAKLVITVDCGITDVKEVALARELGVDVIITDHHLPQSELPAAYAIIDAHQEGDRYPFKGLCGTGVAFKLAEALLARGNFDVIPGAEKWLLDLVAIATVADMVPLTDENRSLVTYGLMVLRKGKRPGLRALFEAERIPIEHATEDDIAFSVAPKINAASRMESPRLAFELLTTHAPERARVLAQRLVKLNQERKLEGMRVAKEVKKRVEAMPSANPILVLGSQSWRPSLLGIAATSVVETYHKTVFLWGMDPSSEGKDTPLIKGSCRSSGDVNMVSLMAAAKDAFLDFGGHELSGGFSLDHDAIHALPAKLEAALRSLKEGGDEAAVSLRGKREPDGELTLAEITDHAFDSLRQLAPFGMENPKPLFRFPKVTLSRMLRFGKTKEHVRMTFRDSAAVADGIVFFVGRTPFRDTLELLSPGDTCTVDASLERSHFAGRTELRLRIEHMELVY